MLESLIFITEKWDGRIKARMCANSSKQRKWMQKEDSSSPTTSIEALFIQSTINAKEKQDNITLDISNAFIQTKHTSKTIHMKIRGELVDILVSIDPTTYEDYVTYENGKKVLYVELLKAIYGTLEAALLFYKKLRKDLENEGYRVNKYDPCVANKIIQRKQHTIVCHVDNLMASHVDAQVN